MPIAFFNEEFVIDGAFLTVWITGLSLCFDGRLDNSSLSHSEFSRHCIAAEARTCILGFKADILL